MLFFIGVFVGSIVGCLIGYVLGKEYAFKVSVQEIKKILYRGGEEG